MFTCKLTDAEVKCFPKKTSLTGEPTDQCLAIMLESPPTCTGVNRFRNYCLGFSEKQNQQDICREIKMEIYYRLAHAV